MSEESSSAYVHEKKAGHTIEVLPVDDTVHDEVFGDIEGKNVPNYRNVGWIGTAGLMMKSMIGLGVLSIPAVFDVLGLIPGVICLIAIATMTTWSNYVVGQFKLAHPDMYMIDDAGSIMFGKAGREALAVCYILFQTFCAGSGMLSISISLNAISEHAICTAGFVVVALLIVLCVASVRTLHKLSPLAWIGLVSIITAILIVTIAVSLQDRPAAAPQNGLPFTSDYKLFGSPSFAQAASALSSLVFAYAGTPSFFGLVSEMRDPRKYTRALIVCNSVVTCAYVVIGVVVYYYCGSYVSSPALGSAGPLLKKIAYGIALPGLIMSSTLLTHLPAKYIFVRALRGSKHLVANTWQHWASWLGAVAGCGIFSYIIASAIPVFGPLVSLVGALLGTLMCMQPMGCMWLYDNYSRGKEAPTVMWRLKVVWAVFIIVMGSFLMVAGTYGAVLDIQSAMSVGGTTTPWGCADNSGTVKSS